MTSDPCGEAGHVGCCQLMNDVRTHSMDAPMKSDHGWDFGYLQDEIYQGLPTGESSPSLKIHLYRQWIFFTMNDRGNEWCEFCLVHSKVSYPTVCNLRISRNTFLKYTFPIKVSLYHHFLNTWNWNTTVFCINQKYCKSILNK